MCSVGGWDKLAVMVAAGFNATGASEVLCGKGLEQSPQRGRDVSMHGGDRIPRRPTARPFGRRTGKFDAHRVPVGRACAVACPGPESRV